MPKEAESLSWLNHRAQITAVLQEAGRDLRFLPAEIEDDLRGVEVKRVSLKKTSLSLISSREQIHISVNPAFGEVHGMPASLKLLLPAVAQNDGDLKATIVLPKENEEDSEFGLFLESESKSPAKAKLGISSKCERPLILELPAEEDDALDFAELRAMQGKEATDTFLRMVLAESMSYLKSVIERRYPGGCRIRTFSPKNRAA